MINNIQMQKVKEYGNIELSKNYFLNFNFQKEVNILDIGCNYGSLIYNLHRSGYKNIYGIDVNKDSIQQGKLLYDIISKNITVYDGEKIPFKDESFDIILMFDVIEHIQNIQYYLNNEVYRVLKKDGVFIFQTPNKYINIPWEIIKHGSLTSWKTSHCSLQTKNSLERILQHSGFHDIIIQKNNILSKFNKSKVRKKIGFIGLPLLHALNKMPLYFYPNFWGSAKK